MGAGEKAAPLKTYVREHATQSTALLPNAVRARAPRDDDWKLYVNAGVQADL